MQPNTTWVFLNMPRFLLEMKATAETILTLKDLSWEALGSKEGKIMFRRKKFKNQSYLVPQITDGWTEWEGV